MSYAFANGAGTEVDPYQVATADDLNGVRDYLSAHFKQVADIDLSGYENWEPIGAYQSEFTGTYDGNGHTVSNLTINSTQNDLGLFGQCYGVTIKNLVLTNVTIQGKPGSSRAIGALASLISTNSTITNCSSFGNVSGFWLVGGLIGHIYNRCSLERCYSACNVSGYFHVGGIVGRAYYNYYNEIHEIKNCYSTGNIVANNRVGGLIGKNDASSNIINCYSLGKVSGQDAKSTGGLVGRNAILLASTITSSYYDTETSGCSDTGKGEPKTTAEMKQQATFVGWDFDTVWAIDPAVNDGYPYLQWQVTDDIQPSSTPRKILPITYPAKYPRLYP